MASFRGRFRCYRISGKLSVSCERAAKRFWNVTAGRYRDGRRVNRQRQITNALGSLLEVSVTRGSCENS